MNTEKIIINIGLGKPIKILQVTDCHLAYTDERDTPKAREKCARKYKNFLAENGGIDLRQRFRDILRLMDHYAATVFTGDIIDCPSPLNLEILEEELAGKDFLYACGNHDCYVYDLDSGTRKGQLEYLPALCTAIGRDATFDSKEVGGVNLVAMDDAFYNFTDEQKTKLLQEIKKQLPILIFLHAPLYHPDIASPSWQRWESLMMTGCPKDVIAFYGETDPQMQATQTTRDVLDIIGNEPLIKAVFAAHTHFKHEGIAHCGKMQYVAESAYLGHLTEIEVL